MTTANTNESGVDVERRDAVRAVAATTLAATAMVGAAAPATLLAAEGSNARGGSGGTNRDRGTKRDSGPLGGRLQGVQHFGLTVQNMNRAY